MKHYTTEHEARKAVADVMKNHPGARVEEIHIDSATSHDWYIAIISPAPYNKVIFKCKWDSPIIKFQ